MCAAYVARYLWTEPKTMYSNGFEVSLTFGIRIILLEPHMKVTKSE
jgi:hypothetical protein